MRFAYSALVLFALAAPVAADPGDRIVVTVGQSEQRDVGMARGFSCDDPSLVRVEMKTVSRKSNVATLTGLAEGKTHCRIGTYAGLPSVVVEVVVVKSAPTSANE
jgi:hypothetical protein